MNKTSLAVSVTGLAAASAMALTGCGGSGGSATAHEPVSHIPATNAHATNSVASNVTPPSAHGMGSAVDLMKIGSELNGNTPPSAAQAMRMATDIAGLNVDQRVALVKIAANDNVVQTIKTSQYKNAASKMCPAGKSGDVSALSKAVISVMGNYANGGSGELGTDVMMGSIIIYCPEALPTFVSLSKNGDN